MSDTVKLIIEMPEETINEIKDNALFRYSISSDIRWDVTSAIVNGIPLDDVKAEIVALPKTYPFVNHIDTYVKEDDVLQILDNIGKAEKGGE